MHLDVVFAICAILVILVADKRIQFSLIRCVSLLVLWRVLVEFEEYTTAILGVVLVLVCTLWLLCFLLEMGDKSSISIVSTLCSILITCAVMYILRMPSVLYIPTVFLFLLSSVKLSVSWRKRAVQAGSLVVFCTILTVGTFVDCSTVSVEKGTYTVDMNFVDKEVSTEEKQKEPVVKKVTYKGGIKSVVTQFSCIGVTQSVEVQQFNEDMSEGRATSVENMSIRWDNTNRICRAYMQVSLGTNVGSSSLEIVNDFTNNRHFTRDNDGGWVEDLEDTLILNIDFDSIESVYDILKWVGSEYIPSKGDKGIKSGGKRTYTLESEATDEDLVGVSYDKVIGKTISFNTDKNNLPISIEKSVRYTADGDTYEIKTIISFEFSNDGIDISDLPL